MAQEEEPLGPGPALALALALFLPAFGTHGLNATVQSLGSELGLAKDLGLYHGLLLAAFALAAVPGYAIAGPLSDRGRRRPLILAGIAGYVIVHLGLLGWRPLQAALDIPPYPLFVTLRLLAGLFGGIVFVSSNALAADLYPAERRGRAMSLVWLGIPAALVLGVPLTAYLTPWAEGLSPAWRQWLGQPYALVALGVSVAATWAVFRNVPDARFKAPRQSSGTPPTASAVFLLAPLVALLMPLAVFELLATVSEHTRRAFQWGEVENGHLFLILGLTGVVGGVASSLVTDRLGNHRCLLLAQGSFAVLVLLLVLCRGPWFLLVGGLLSLLSTMRQGPFQALVAGMVAQSRRGKMSALILASGAVGTASGQVIGSSFMGGAHGFTGVVVSAAGAMLLAIFIFALLWRTVPMSRVS